MSVFHRITYCAIYCSSIGVGCLVKMNDRYGRPVVFCLGFIRRHGSDVFRNAPIQDCSSLSGEAANKMAAGR